MGACGQDAGVTSYILHKSRRGSKVNLRSRPEKGRPFVRRPFVFSGIFPNAIRK
jgi:helix-turn-helix protein